jgi:hypothetical protein
VSSETRKAELLLALRSWFKYIFASATIKEVHSQPPLQSVIACAAGEDVVAVSAGN